jgi:hypothetical protein
MVSYRYKKSIEKLRNYLTEKKELKKGWSESLFFFSLILKNSKKIKELN